MDQVDKTSTTDKGPEAYAAFLQVLGGLSLRGGSDKPVELTARKSRQLLAYLAVPPGQVRSRDQLAALLWNDRQDEQARGSLRTALTGIRRALGDDALIVEQDTVRLRPGSLQTDYDRLKALATNDGTAESLGDFYQGEFLAGNEHDSELFTDWLRGLRHECVDLAIEALERNARRVEKAGDNKKALSLLRESLSLEPLREQTHRKIMRLYAADGERAMALAQFRTCKDVLLHELDVGPDPETQALADRIALRDTSVSNDLRRPAARNDENSAFPRQIPIPDETSDNPDEAMPSIAVLPFVNMSADAEQTYFADGVTEDISIDLSEYDTLSVTPKSSGEIYRGSQMPVAQIAQELKVRYLLQGSVRKSGQTVRVSAILIDAMNNRQIWAERFDRTLEDIFELQSDIARSIVAALKVNLNLGDTQPQFRQITSSGEAYQIYLRANSFREARVKTTNILALELYEQAIELDPEFAHAYAALAECQASLADQNEPEGDVFQAALDEAMTNCQKALQIAPDLPHAHLTMGHIFSAKKNHDKAKELYLKSIALDPKYGDAYFCLANHYLSAEGNAELAFANFKKAFLHNPDNRNCMMLLTTAVMVESPKLKAYAEEVLKFARRRIESNPHDFDAAGSMSFANYYLGNMAEARYWAGITAAFDVDDRFFYYNNACMFAMVGSIEEALEALERALAYPDPYDEPDYIRTVDPDLENLRQDPRFYALIDKYYS